MVLGSLLILSPMKMKILQHQNSKIHVNLLRLSCSERQGKLFILNWLGEGLRA